MPTLLLRQQSSKLYKVLEKGLRIFHQNNTEGMFDKYQYNIYGKSKHAFVGKKMCGASCFILKYLLEDLGHNVKVLKILVQMNLELKIMYFYIRADILLILRGDNLC